MGLKRDRDELKRAFQELKARHALLAIEEAQVASEPARCDSGGSLQFQQSEEQVTGSGEDKRQIERELIELRQEHRNLQAVLARDKRQIGRALSELKSAREAWLNSRRTLRDAIDQRNQAHSKS
jgi:hypothetical protein